ncbi:MAG: prepilin-type N-terminal cleavage/methylation domain-containing protein [Lachnospiraceae bacterium]|nr:prepilin-type N-terminal cleavage/methylation domain-containing protein [Lachnospiraceae bacterium]
MKKMNNKGFSLVELIIVIAIMAILIGVLAPQYLKYVEKSRTSADKDQLDSIYNACTIAASDPDIADAPIGGSSVNWSTSWGGEVMSTLGVTNMNSLKWKSKSAGQGNGAPSVTVDAQGNFTITRGSLSVPEN